MVYTGGVLYLQMPMGLLIKNSPDLPITYWAAMVGLWGFSPSSS
jgi:hypothetical protein